MMNLKGKKLVLCILSLILCVTACAPAFASTGDRVVIRRAEDESGYIQRVLPYGDGGFYIFVQEYPNLIVKRFADYKAEPEEFVYALYEEDTTNWWLEELKNEDSQDGQDSQEGEGEDDESFFADDSAEADEGQAGGSYENIYDFFNWNNEIYALANRCTYDEEGEKNEILVKRLKLEDGQVVMEEDNVPTLDFSGLVDSETGNLKFYGSNNMITTGDSLFMTYWGETGEKLMVFDLNSGDYTEGDIEDVSEITAGPEGSLLVTREKWGDDPDNYDVAKVTITRMDPDSLNEEPLTELKIKGSGTINPCYDARTDTLYYLAGGELWAMPQFDAEKAAAVNDCPDTGNGMMMLKDGFVLVQMFSSVMVKNTDPAQRGSTQLRIKAGGYEAVRNAIYDMNNTRGDISVVLENDWTYEKDIVQAMMNRDAYTDIYMLNYQSNEFNALYSRGYLIDLGDNEKIAENTARMYPYIQEALKQDGKIIAVPAYAYGYSLGVNVDALKMLGLKEEDLPHTWNQFFDWMEKLPALMENAEVKISWDDRTYLRSSIMECMIEQYELWMQQKGENDYSFNNPILCDLMRRLNNLDYDGLGAKEPVEYNEDSEDEDYYYEDDGKMVLMESYVATTMNGDNYYIPLQLSFTEEDPVIPVELEVLFVNPYSEHIEEAKEFLGAVLNNLSLSDQYNFYTDKTEPVRYSNGSDNLTMLREAIDAYKAEIEKAEGERKVNLEEKLKGLEEELEQNERYSWRISPELIERYLKNQNLFRVRSYSFYNALWGSQNNQNEDEPSAYASIFLSEDSMKKEPEELLGMLDSKVQMIRLEGN